MRATGSNDVVITDVFVPGHRLVRVSDIYTGTAPGAGLHDADTYRWPMVPALALLAAMPALGSAERAADIYAERLLQRVLAYEGVTQKDKPIAQAHLAEARVRARCAGCSPTPSVRSKPSLPQAIPCHGPRVARPDWRRRTSCTSRGR